MCDAKWTWIFVAFVEENKKLLTPDSDEKKTYTCKFEKDGFNALSTKLYLFYLKAVFLLWVVSNSWYF